MDFFMDGEPNKKRSYQQKKKKKKSLDGCPHAHLEGATNTTIAPGRQKPSRRHWFPVT
jgi:hypothetical protein